MVTYFQITPCCQDIVLLFEMKGVICNPNLPVPSEIKVKCSDENVDCKKLHQERLEKKRNYDRIARLNETPEKKSKKA